MRVFSVPSSYARFIELRIQAALDEVRRDADCRADEDARVRAFASVPDDQFKPSDTGNAVIMIGIVPDDDGEAVFLIRPPA